jgi:prevent-host-death family protein
MERTVGIKELNQDTSGVVRAVKNGATLLLTDRGVPWGVLTPYVEAGALARLEAQGLATPASAAVFTPPAQRVHLREGEGVDDVLGADRQDGEW